MFAVLSVERATEKYKELEGRVESGSIGKLDRELSEYVGN
jgi:hypothetical protein